MHVPVNSAVAKKLWNFLRVAYFMMRKGVISKRKLIMDMNLMMKRGKLLRKTVSNLMSHHHSRNMTRGGGGFGLQEYEFSCSNSPNPVFFHVSNKRKHHYFPCINPPRDEDDEDNHQEVQAASAAVVVLPTAQIEYSPEYNFKFRLGTPNLAPAGGERLSPLLSPFSVRVSSFSSDDEINEMGINPQVDDDAEEFIRRFYEQLRMQSRTQLLEYQASP